MSLHRACCCEGSCGDCPCRFNAYSVNWTGSVSFVSDQCGCRNYLGLRNGIRVADFTVSDGTTRTLTNRVVGTTTYCDALHPALGSTPVSLVLGTAAFKEHYDTACTVSTTCPNALPAQCDLEYGVLYTLYKPNSPVCKWVLKVQIRPLGRLEPIAVSPFTEQQYLSLWYESTYSSCTASSATFTYLGAAYDDSTPVAVGDCVNATIPGGFGVSEQWFQGEISGISGGTVTLS